MLDLDEGEQTEQGGFADEELPADESELGKELLRHRSALRNAPSLSAAGVGSQV